MSHRAQGKPQRKVNRIIGIVIVEVTIIELSILLNSKILLVLDPRAIHGNIQTQSYACQDWTLDRGTRPFMYLGCIHSNMPSWASTCLGNNVVNIHPSTTFPRLFLFQGVC